MRLSRLNDDYTVMSHYGPDVEVTKVLGNTLISNVIWH